MTTIHSLLIPALVADADGRFGTARPAAHAALALGVGGFVLYGGEQDAVRVLAKELQQRSRTPLLIGADLERGAGQQFAGATGLPPLAALAWLDDLEALRRAARLTAREARTMGVNWNFAPMCDLDVDAANPVLGTRTLGSDPELVARRAVAWIEACQAEGVVACAKHFPGHGRTQGDSHTALPVVEAGRDTMHATDLVPFRAAFAAGVASVMTAHVAYPALDPSGLPATLSRELLTWLLRQQLRYDGLVVADTLSMTGVLAAVDGDECEAAVRALAAGCDVLLGPSDVAATAAALDRALAERRLDPERVQQSVRRRLKWAQWAAPPNDWRRPMAADAAWGAQLVDRVIHVVRGTPGPVGGWEGAALEVAVLDDDLHAEHPESARLARAHARETMIETLRAAGRGVRLVETPTPGVATPLVVALYGEVRPWKARLGYADETLAHVARLGEAARALGRRTTVVQFGDPRLASTLPGEADVICAWSGDRAMQQAAARYLLAQRGG